MKRPLLLAVCLLSATVATLVPLAPVRAQTGGSALPPPSGGNPFLDEGKNTVDDLRNAIIKRPYTFEVDGWVMHIHFDPTGKGAEEDWSFKWHARDGHTIELVSPKFPGMKAVLTFSDDYATYTGFHFDGLKAVKGKQVIPH